MLAQPSKRTQVLSSPMAPDRSSPPPILDRWAADQGFNLVLQNGHRDQVATLHSYGFSVLFVEDVPEEYGDIKDFRQQAVRDARREGFEMRDGQFLKSDCILYLLSEDRRAAMEEEARSMFLMQDRGSLETALEEFEELASGPGKGSMRAAIPEGVARSLSDHVTNRIVPDDILESGSNSRPAGPTVRRRAG